MESPDAEPDIVGRASARLLAKGVDRRDRLAALHLLAVLDASTDSSGRVRRPLDDLADEFDLTPMSVLRSLDHLERAGAIERDGGTVVLLDRDRDGVGGLHLAAFLDDVRASLDDAPRPVVSHSPWRARAGAALVAAAAVAVVTLAPSQPSVAPSLAVAPSTSTGSGTSGAPQASTSVSPRATDAIAPGDAPVTSAAADGDGVIAAAQCPTGAPVAQLAGTIVRITNPTTADIVVEKLTIGGVTSSTPFVVEAGQTVERELPVAPPGASIDSWTWRDSELASRCTS
jgi:hypothetical protein